MLTQISINNYTIVSSLEMDFSDGMTVITGETGAGKSIMLDALGLCLGDRADPKAVRNGCERAEVVASFDIGDISGAQAWLAERELLSGDECLLRRVVTAEGRSRAYINGSPSTLQDCAELGGLLIDIHSQHAHQSLLRKPVQRQLLDAFAGHIPLARELEQTASDWLRSRRELELLTGAQDEHTARAQLLGYQVEELAEQKMLANAEDILHTAQQALTLCEDQETGEHQALQLLGGDTHVATAVQNARDLLDSSAIQLSEARSEIQQYLDGVEVDPQRLEQVSRRLEAIYDVARKHRVMPEALVELQQALREELDGLRGGSERIEDLQGDMQRLADDYNRAATRLSKQRGKAAKKLVQQAEETLATLAMEQCRLEVALTPRDSSDPHPHGAEDIELLISTNPGAPTQPLGKIASGGELSRISLAIQVVTASSGTVPSMVFDEVDVGIGGAVAEVVGRLLRSLAAQAQVLCVTHLPQVAAQGHQHLQVSKSSDKTSVETRLDRLEEEQKVAEIARMLGGVKITDQTLAHAREMLAQA
jgi:DNA repair protein RecN (Recombination protein N)